MIHSLNHSTLLKKIVYKFFLFKNNALPKLGDCDEEEVAAWRLLLLLVLNWLFMPANNKCWKVPLFWLELLGFDDELLFAWRLWWCCCCCCCWIIGCIWWIKFQNCKVDVEFRGNSNPGRKQCDQMARLFFNIWPFTTMKFCPKAYKKSKSGFTTLPNIKYTFQMLPKISKFLLNWRNFAKSGHTANGPNAGSFNFYFSTFQATFHRINCVETSERFKLPS